MTAIALPERKTIAPRLEFPAWVQRIGDPLKMLSPLGGTLTPLGMSGAVQTPLLLDQVTGAAAAYSLRKLRNAYAGSAVRVRRSSDDTEQDIGFSGADFDTSAFSSFIGGGSGYVKTWYDQSGNSYNATQSTAANQPQIVLSVQNGKAAVYFDGSNDKLTSSSIALLKSHTLFAATKCTTDAERAIAGNYSPYNYILLNSTNAWYRATDFMARVHSATSNNTYLFGWERGDSSTVTIYKNASSLGAGAMASDNNQTFTLIGYDGVYPYKGYLLELVYFAPVLTTNARQTAESDINTYYAIY